MRCTTSADRGGSYSAEPGSLNLPDQRHYRSGFLHVPLRVNLRNICRGVTKDDLRGLESKSLPNLCRRGMPQLIGVPGVFMPPVAREPLPHCLGFARFVG